MTVRGGDLAWVNGFLRGARRRSLVEFIESAHTSRGAISVIRRAIADQLNGRLRQTLGFKTPSEALAEVLR